MLPYVAGLDPLPPPLLRAVCVGGCPDRHDPADAARRVAAMALDMLDFTRGFTTADGRKIQIRIGCYTGNVTAAVVGLKMHHMWVPTLHCGD